LWTIGIPALFLLCRIVKGRTHTVHFDLVEI